MEYRLNDEYGSVIILDEYNDKFYVISAKEKDGVVHKQWCKVSIGKDRYADKAMPLSVRLGTKEQAIEIMTLFLEQLTGRPVETVDDSDIPF